MAAPASRGASRDRHGRSIRRPVLSKLFAHGQSRIQSFDSVVSNTCEFLMDEWKTELDGMGWRIEDAPPIGPTAKEVKRWAVRHDTKTVIIYRLPIERLGGSRRNHPMDERMRIEQCVFEAVASLMGKEPWELLP